MGLWRRWIALYLPSPQGLLLLTLVCARLAAAQENRDPSKGCTSTLILTQSRLPTPPYWPQCSWDGTLTVYPSTVTIGRSVDCDGCIAEEFPSRLAIDSRPTRYDYHYCANRACDPVTILLHVGRF